MVHAHGARIRVEGLQPAQVLAALVGVVFLVFGIVGFTRTGFGDFAGHHDAGFWRFSANPMNNLVHVVTGLLGLALAFGSGRARVFGWLLFLGYGVLFVWGLMITGTITANPFANAGNPLDVTAADNWLHLGIAALGLFIAVLPARRRVRIPEQTAATPEGADDVTTVDRVAPATAAGPAEGQAATARDRDPVVQGAGTARNSGVVNDPAGVQNPGAVNAPGAVHNSGAVNDPGATVRGPAVTPTPREKRGPGLAH